MALFGNEAKKQAKRLSVGDWMLWSYEIRVASNEAAAVVSQTQLAGEDMAAIGTRLFNSAWEGAANEALEYYSRPQVQAAYDDQTLRRRAISLLAANQVNASLNPPFPPELLHELQNTLPPVGAVAQDRAFWAGTEPMDADSLEEVISEVSRVHLESDLSPEERDSVLDSALAWVDRYEPEKAMSVREVFIQAEIGRHLRELNAERDGVDDELIANKALLLLFEMVKNTTDNTVTPETMAGYFDRGIPTIVDMMFQAIVDSDAVGLGTERQG